VIFEGKIINGKSELSNGKNQIAPKLSILRLKKKETQPFCDPAKFTCNHVAAG